MKILFDANILIAALISHGACKDLFDHCLGEHEIFTSQLILQEVRQHLINKFGFTEKETRQAINFLKINAAIIPHSPLPSSVCRDPDDDNILAAASAGDVNCLITGDKDLLVLKNFQKIPILKPAAFWKFEKETPQA